jgi:hypothetical protein
VTGPDPDVERLADLDAGLLDDDRAAAVRAAALADPRSAAVLDALAATRAELGALTPPPVPPLVAARWSAALADLDPPAPAARSRRRPVLLAAAALLVALLGAGVLVATGGLDPRTTAAVTGADLGAVGRGAIGSRDFGPVEPAACLAGLRVPGGVAGGRPVRFDGTPGVLLVVTTGERGRFRAVVVDEACSRTLADAVIGG